MMLCYHPLPLTHFLVRETEERGDRGNDFEEDRKEQKKATPGYQTEREAQG